MTDEKQQMTVELMLALLGRSPDFGVSSPWQWYWPRSNKYVAGELPLIKFVGVLAEKESDLREYTPRSPCDRVSVYSRDNFAGELFFPLGDGRKFAEDHLQMIRLPPQRAGCCFYKELDPDRDVAVYICFPPEARVCISSRRDSPGLDDAFYYPTTEQAIEAAMAWDGIGEPAVGWNRHLATNRWRKGGDPAQETIGEWL